MNLGHETEQVEFKKSTSELKEGAVSVAAILNKHGRGELYFGVKPNGDACGQDVAESTLRQISQTLGNSIEPRIYPVVEEFDDGEGHSCIRVSFEGDDRPYACKGAYCIRVADEDVAMTAAQIESMMTERINRKFPWDERSSGRTAADVKEDVLRAYVERGRKRGRIPFDYADAHDALSRLGLLCDDGTLTNAADALFCKSRYVRLKMGILATHARTEILDLHQESGTVFELVDKARAYILNNTRRRFVINESGPRDEIPELPTLAVKEALMNAYAHCDWTLGGCVQIDIFNDAVEILSLGWFVEGQDPEEHLSGESVSSQGRNKLIAQAMYRSGDIEAYGTGIPRMRDLCDEAGVRIEYVRVPEGTKLVFHRSDAFADSMADNWPIMADNWPIMADSDKLRPSFSATEMQVCEYLSKRESARTTEIATETGISDRTVRRVLKRLSERGIIISEGANKNRTYRLLDDVR